MKFLPLSGEKTESPVDVVLVTGDAYVDHPSFAMAVLGRTLEKHGYTAGIISMPDMDPSSFKAFGKPRLFFGVASGHVDSMIARYTAFNRPRSDDPYAPGGKAGHRPERAVIVYCNLIKQAYKDTPIVIGGIEASTRRFAHYDFWSNKVRRSILQDSRADILVYGMGESQIIKIADRLAAGQDLKDIPGTVIISHESPEGSVIMPSEEEVISSKDSFLDFYNRFYMNKDSLLAQPAGKRYIVQYPSPSVTSEDLDAIYDLPYTRKPHPLYREAIPAYEMIRNSITCHRGCVSGCSFCSLSLHQGRRIISRTRQSILREAGVLAETRGFKGHITDIGGPSANMYGYECSRAWICGRESCTYPELCSNLKQATGSWINLLDRASDVKGIKSVTVGSGIRHDVFMADPDHQNLLRALTGSHISGQLKIAPEHTSLNVLRAMRKLPLYDLKEFVELFRSCNAKTGKKQYIIPYFMTCHPGCGYSETEALRKDALSIFGFLPDQAQAFIPLPMTLSSVIYYTGHDPLSGERFFVQKDKKKRRKQHNIYLEKKAF